MNKRFLFVIAKYLLAIPMIIFGLNKFLLFANVPPPVGETAQHFLGAMFTSYLAIFVGIIEIIGGILLLVPRTSFLGLLLLLPVVANITLFHLAHDAPGNGIWIGTLVVTLITSFAFKDHFAGLIQSKQEQLS